MNIGAIVSRKLVSASIAACLFVILFAFLDPNLRRDSTWNSQIRDFAGSIAFIIVYAWPVIFLYGTVASVLSELISRGVVRGTGKRKSVLRGLFCAVLHLAFGLVLGPVSLLAALVFFAADGVLAAKGGRYGGLSVLKSLLLPIALFGCAGMATMLAS